MTNPVVIHRYGNGLSAVVPGDAPTVLDPVADIDVMALEVAGGYLTWNVLAGQAVPAAVIDDANRAQEWLWAIYGEPVALALHDEHSATVAVEPGLPPLATSARRLAYAHWASRWWPASTLDAIAPLDSGLLDRDIATLTEECESLVDGADAIPPLIPEVVETFPRASDYALAAGEDTPGGLVLARGGGGWDWRRCPPGLIDASERAVSWRVIRDGGETVAHISAVAYPGASDRPAHLMPWARVGSGGTAVDTALRLVAGAWVGSVPIPAAGGDVHVDIHLPGFGAAVDNDAVALRRRVREFAAARLRLAGSSGGTGSDAAHDYPLLAEVAAAAEDSDF